ncbi:hypothetical protein E4T50_05520 [Aureobasidium sp. EXF-12298]|nr:hypothetical protein E4T50_05520 [Aureobasidium sp. EXF-12298]
MFEELTTKSSTMDSVLALKHSLAKAETIHRERQLLALQTLYPGQGYIIRNIAGSTTILSPPEFGRKINHTYGFALSGKVLPDDLRAIEAVYEQNGVCPDFDMCEFADTSGFNLLSAHYKITGSLCEYQQSLSDFQYPATLGSSIDIAILGPEDHDTFVQASVGGFRSGGRPVELLKALAESAATRSDTILFSASIDDDYIECKLTNKSAHAQEATDFAIVNFLEFAVCSEILVEDVPQNNIQVPDAFSQDPPSSGHVRPHVVRRTSPESDTYGEHSDTGTIRDDLSECTSHIDSTNFNTP